MDNVKNDFYYVKRLLRSIEITSRYLKDKSMDDLINDGFLHFLERVPQCGTN